MNPATLIATIFFFMIAILHLVRLFFHVELTVNGAMVPMWLSIFGFLFTASLAIMMWRENWRKKTSMPRLTMILSHLAARLREEGAQFSPRPLEIMSGAMLFLETMGNPLNNDVATAAYATSQLKLDDAKQVAIALGVSPDLIPMLTPTVIGVDHKLGHVLAKGYRPQAVVAATVLFAWYTMAAKGGNDERLAALRKIVYGHGKQDQLEEFWP